MKKLVSLMAIGLALSLGAAHAAEPTKTPQQTKMGTCNKEAADKKGDERKAFMKTCLSAKPAATTQQSKMTTCNKDAGDKKGDERKAFMKTCLSAKT
jgi:psiF repeat